MRILLADTLIFIFCSFPPGWGNEWHKHHMAAISSDKFDSLLKTSQGFSGCKSSMATFVLIRSKRRIKPMLFSFSLIGSIFNACTGRRSCGGKKISLDD